MASNTRVGIGYDVHPLVGGRRLVLGGVQIPYEKGLEGWSDADVLVHAVMDALLGAAALGDIGSHFPPGERAYQNADSLELLKQVGDKLEKAGWRAGNLDATIMAEAPRLKDHLPKMAANLAAALRLAAGDVSVKAGTGEKMGFVGRGEGIAAQAVALIEKSR